MTDFSSLFAYDEAHVVNIKNPKNGEDTGIKIGVMSIDSDSVISALRKLEGKRWKDQSSGVDINIVEHVAEQEKAGLIAAITSWDFGDGRFGDLTSDSPVTDENKAYLVNHPRSLWIRVQLVEAFSKIENFTQELSESAANT